MTDDVLRGLPRARELLARVEDGGTDPVVMTGRIAHAQAIAAVELASATQLGALASVASSPLWNRITEEERNAVTMNVTALLGVSRPPQ